MTKNNILKTEKYMKKIGLSLVAFIIAVASICAQTAGNHIQQIDNTVRTLAGELNRKIVEERSQRIALGQFSYRGNITPLGAYWANQLTNELTNIRNRSFTLLSSGIPEWTVSGEIVVVDDIVRIYTRLIRRADQAIVSAIHSDLQKDGSILLMLSSGSGDGSISSVLYDEWEPDDWNNPVTFEIGADSNAPFLNRTLHSTNDNDNGDEDFFLLLPNINGRIVMETTGDTDTYMELYNADTGELLAEDDDSAFGNNARIRVNVQTGKRYIAKVRGYSSSATGNYGFRAYIQLDDWSNPIVYEIGAGMNSARIAQRTLDSDGGDIFLLQPNRNGTLVMETTGDTDTYMELYNADTHELLAEDDDSGSGEYNALIRHNVQSSRRYIAKVRGYSSSTEGDYNFRAYFGSEE
jgi:hypothetical protein